MGGSTETWGLSERVVWNLISGEVDKAISLIPSDAVT